MPGDTIVVPKQVSIESLVAALEHARTVTLASTARSQADSQELQAQAEAALALIDSGTPRARTPLPPTLRLFNSLSFKAGNVDGQQALSVESGTALIDSAGLLIDSDVNTGKARGVVLGHLFSEGVLRAQVEHATQRLVLNWGVQDAPGYVYAVWDDGTVIQCGWWKVAADLTISDVQSRVSIAIPADNYTAEVLVGPSVQGSGFVVRVWGNGDARPDAPSGAVGYDATAPLLAEGRIGLASLSGPVRVQSLTVDDTPSVLLSKVAPIGRWFTRFEAARQVLCTTTSGAELRTVVSGTPGVGLVIAIPAGMSYRPIVPARWREFGKGLPWGPWVRTQVPDGGGPGSLIRIDPVTGLNPNLTYEVQLGSAIYENDQHWAYGSGLCVAELIVATGGTAAPWYDPSARWVEADGDSITAGVAMLPYPASGPPSQPSNLLSELNYLHVACDLLGAIPVNNGFGGTGVLVSGSGGVPLAARNTSEYMNGRPRRDLRQPDVILINHLTNDAGAVGRTPSVIITSQQARAGYADLVQQRRAANPSSAVVAMRPFNGAFWPEIQDVARALSVPTIDTTGWLAPVPADYTDGTHPTLAGQAKAGQRLASALTEMFGAGYW